MGQLHEYKMREVLLCVNLIVCNFSAGLVNGSALEIFFVFVSQVVSFGK